MSSIYTQSSIVMIFTQITFSHKKTRVSQPGFKVRYNIPFKPLSCPPTVTQAMSIVVEH